MIMTLWNLANTGFTARLASRQLSCRQQGASGSNLAFSAVRDCKAAATHSAKGHDPEVLGVVVLCLHSLVMACCMPILGPSQQQLYSLPNLADFQAALPVQHMQLCSDQWYDVCLDA